MLSDVNGALCRAYVGHRGSIAAARRELEELRAAINHHRKEGLCSAIVEVVLPAAAPARERWLTRAEAAALLRAAWRYREVQKGKRTRKTCHCQAAAMRADAGEGPDRIDRLATRRLRVASV